MEGSVVQIVSGTHSRPQIRRRRARPLVVIALRISPFKERTETSEVQACALPCPHEQQPVDLFSPGAPTFTPPAAAPGRAAPAAALVSAPAVSIKRAFTSL